MARSVGIDIAKAKVDVAIILNNPDSGSGSEVKTRTFANQTEKDMEFLVNWLKENGVDGKTPIVIESTGSYHWLSCILLSEQGFLVHLINPLLTKRYEKASIRGAKTDRVDAKRLAEIGIIEEDLPLFFDSRQSLSSKKYHSLYAKIKKVYQTLKRTYEDALESGRSIGLSLELGSIEDCLKQMESTLRVLREIIEENTSPISKELSKIKGISSFQASILCNAISGKTFNNKDKLIAFFGLDIRGKQSGMWRGKEKLSKRGNSFYRMILFQLGWSLVMNNEEFKAYYQRLRSQDKHYYTCLIATARKFLRFFYAHYLNPKIV